MNRHTKRAAVAAVAGIGSLALPMIGCLATTAAADTTLVLFEHDTEQNVIDHGKPGPGPGDQFIFAGDVFDRPGGVFLGRATGICTTLTGDQTAGETTCGATFTLEGGQIAVQGLVDNAALFVRGDPTPLYITGGTGIYRTARGDGTIQVPIDVPDQTDANFVLNVVTT
ncbi:MAG TPA: hypothetical protein VGO30_15620 [Mycobacterium sp.]|jgi:hypothetical protein|nr:hypothetical protein [Mycobacterium sp.]